MKEMQKRVNMFVMKLRHNLGVVGLLFDSHRIERNTGLSFKRPTVF